MLFGPKIKNEPLVWVTDDLGVGHAPMSYAQLNYLKENGVDAILNLCAEFCDLHEIEEQHGFEVYYLPIVDEEAPDLIELEKALAWMDEAIYLGKKVFIHCRHGIGRTGTVLNSYLLRRGLGSKMAGKVLKRLPSKPTNYEQWSTVRKYGKKSGRLTVREPSLEFKRLVDLAPFFDDYDQLTARVEDLTAYERKDPARCGRDHANCCRTPVVLQLAEAVYVNRKLNQYLTSEKRVEIIEKAVETARREREVAREQAEAQAEAQAPADAKAAGEFCLSRAGAECPLLEGGRCLLFEHRPLQCRTFDLTEETKTELWDNMLAPSLHKISQELFFAYTSSFAGESPPSFSLADVVSGRYVETFFHALLQAAGE